MNAGETNHFRSWRRGATAAAMLGAFLLAVPAADAAVRYADPAGTNTDDCPLADPCDFKEAVEEAVGGDEVIVLPGTHVPGSGVNVIGAIQVHGQVGAARPLVEFSSAAGLQLISSTATVSDLEITNSAGVALFLAGATAERVIATSTQNLFLSSGCRPGSGATIRDSICRGAAAATRGIRHSASGGGLTANLVNVTAIAADAPAIELEVTDAGAEAFDVRNSIARSGGAVDVRADAQNAGGTATIDLATSNYGTREEAGPGNASVTEPGTGTNQTDPPLFVDAGAADFHQLPGSPTIDAGAPDPMLGTLDLDRTPRVQGPAPDIGAYEFPVAAPPVSAAAPRAMIRRRPAKRTSYRRARFRFVSTRRGSRFRCALRRQQRRTDRRPGNSTKRERRVARFRGCRSPRIYSGLRPGRYVFLVRAIAPDGSVQARPTRFSWRIRRR